MLNNRPTPHRGRAAVYCRASTDNQDTALSTATQAEHARRQVELQGFHVGEEDIFIDEAFSGMTGDRPAFRAMMMKALSPGKHYAAISVTDISRLSRSTSGYIDYEDMLAAEGIELISGMEPQGHSQAKINTIRRMKAVMNEEQVVQTAIKTRDGQMFAVEMGFFIGNTRPFGYRKNKVMLGRREHVKLEPHPDEWPHLLHIVEMAKSNYTLSRLREYLEGTGFIHPAGELHTKQDGLPVRIGNGEWTNGNISYLLTENDALLGWTSRGGEESGTRLLHKSEKMICQDAHPAAMSEKDRELIIDNFAARNRKAKNPRTHTSPNPMSGIVRCGMCDSTMQMHTSHGTGRLICANKREYTKDHPKWCPNKPVRLDVLIHTTLDAILGHILTPKALQKLVKSVADMNREFVENQSARKKQIEKRIRDLQRQIHNLAAAVAEYGPRNPTWGEQSEVRNNELQLLQRELQAIDDDLKLKMDFLLAPDRIINNALSLRADLESDDQHELAQVLTTLIKRATILDQTVTLEYALPLPKNGTDTPILVETLKLSKKSCRSVGHADAKLRGHTETIGQRLERDLEALLPLPPAPSTSRRDG